MVHRRLYLEVRGTCQETGGPREAILLTREAQELMERLSGIRQSWWTVMGPNLTDDKGNPIDKMVSATFDLKIVNADVLLDSRRQILEVQMIKVQVRYGR